MLLEADKRTNVQIYPPLQGDSETFTLRIFTPSFKNYINVSSEQNPAPKDQ